MIEVIKEGVIEIENSAYLNRVDIDEVRFPNSLKIIKGKAFSGCFSLKVIIFPRGIERIGDEAFAKVKGIFFIPNSIKYIGREAFAKGSELYFEGEEKSFDSYYHVEQYADYPFDYYRGPSMGMSYDITRFYEYGASVHYNILLEDFMKIVEESL